ncbi:HdeD family acid-resistance protein [Aliirhizobium cellulosilyticum]|uniref:Uncharacterized membrane protein HdeD (DUF308 family) n=1 Tax=Aliirhizobium cellulosilyticum TaxID=393664 RepID=A0A7W6Y2J1_9HYPH|nr:HdeD family acid-resistance protein [Rhizobium cellulosilyticum]MBB4349403.1 uncharacterized membrane protein HdeD (DUF308 family) [Rhizobium cellulosilyticum]MBB4412375.1 uncharacterized membrane protein HdeD (DUF308 family) [Rhizobium cellulosilyticum]MBB4447007.1 uncharacterized membrane protein HdeD (DUF308 family) [Rhizobium cellulosilyticum]
MTTISASADLEPSVKEARANWAWFVALGFGLIVVGLIASANLFLSTLASVIYIAGMMLAGAIMQVAHAFSTSGWKQKTFSGLSAVLYGVVGAVLIYDPLLSALNVTLIVAAFMIAAGIARIAIGFRERAQKGWGWIVASGVASMAVGLLVVSMWPGVGLWFLGAMLTFDLIFQGLGFLAFGLALYSKK